ncbi:MAG: NAD(P)-dependent oxidoreductase [Ignavibacteria bacterium]|nr:NAD(P)-dependent oxidoreductase [Ignavibacteria bacterium]
MKVLVTGATGFIGSFVAEFFLAKGFDVRCTIRGKSNLRWLEGKNYEIVKTNFENPEELKNAVIGVDYVVHVAGTIAAKNYNEYLKGNRDATSNLLRAVELFNPTIKKFTFVSSLTAAGPASSLENPVDETTICRPITNYGQSKLEAEKEVLNYREIFPITIVRLPAIYGPRDTALVDMFRLAKIGLTPLIGFKEKYVSLLYVDDAVEGIYLATLSDNSRNEIFFISSERFYTWNEMMDSMKIAIGKKTITIKIPHFIVFGAAYISELISNLNGKVSVFNVEKAKDFTQKYWICSSKKAFSTLGFRQKVQLPEGMKKTYLWYIENGWIS